MHRHNALTEKEKTELECLSSVDEQPSQENINELLLAEIAKKWKRDKDIRIDKWTVIF